MLHRRSLSIRTKMTLLSCASSGAALLMAFVGFAVNGVQTLAAAKFLGLENRAQLMAFYISPVLTLRDPTAGEKAFETLEADPTIEGAWLFDRNKQLVAKWGEATDTPFSALGPEGTGRPLLGCLPLAKVLVTQPVIVAGQDIGTLYLRANSEDLKGQLAEFAQTGGYMLGIALLISVALSWRLQRSISLPIVALTRATQRVTQNADYSIRVDSSARAELKTLQDAFNGMLEHIQRSDQALQQAHDELEERVFARTAELSQEVARRTSIQEALERAKEAAEAANLAKSEFLANMSHEIRTPLNGIIGFTDVLLSAETECTAEDRREYLQTIHRSGHHLLELISDVLDISKIEAGRLEVERISCSPHQIIADVVSVLRVRAREKGLRLELQCRTRLPDTVLTDPARLRQLLINLISNAIKFTEQGEIRIIAGITADQPAMLQLEVADTGIGIAADKLTKIFEPFTQADSSVTRRFGGTGLGLAICRRIAEALGGGVTVASDLGRGSTFTVTIDPGPLQAASRLDENFADFHPEPRSTGPAPCSLHGTRILVVDDGDTNRKLTRLILHRAGAEVITAENGVQALEAASRQTFDVVLMDMQMPVMDGYTATRLLRKSGVKTPIVALTAHAMKGDEETCRAAGCSEYLTKPIEAHRLLSAIAPLVNRQVDAASGRQERPALPVEPGTANRIHSALPTDDPEFSEIVAEFVDHLQTHLEQMRLCLDGEQFSELAAHAHWLKGAGGTAGFPMLTHAAREMEKAARDGRAASARTALEEIQQLKSRIATPARLFEVAV